MDEKQIILEQYKLYVESKDRFIARSFRTNRFYMVVALILVFALWYLYNYPSIGIPVIFFKKAIPIAPIIVSILGIFSTILWWINNDAYRFLSKIKLSKVIEAIEEHLPVKPHADEYAKIQEQLKDKNVLFFGDIQKAFAVVFLSIFVITFVNEIILFLCSKV